MLFMVQWYRVLWARYKLEGTGVPCHVPDLGRLQ